MQRPTGVAAVAGFSAIVMGLFARSPYAEAGGNCEAKLAGKSYNCSWVVSDGPSFTECDEFVTGGVSSFFDFLFSSMDWGCA